MIGKCKYEFDSSLGILHKIYYGAITIEDIISTWEYAFNNNLIPEETKGFILDYRNASFNIQVEKYIMIADFYKQNIQIFGNYKFAILVNSPKDIVVPMLVETKDDGYQSKPFSTLEAAIKWVLN